MKRPNWPTFACVYAIINPFTNEPFYLGSTLCAYYRFIQHVNAKADTAVSQHIRSIISKGKQPYFMPIQIFPKDQYYNMVDKERYWIKVFKNELSYDLKNTNVN